MFIVWCSDHGPMVGGGGPGEGGPSDIRRKYIKIRALTALSLGGPDANCVEDSSSVI